MNATSPGRGEPSEFPWYCGKSDAHPEHRVTGDGYYGEDGYICDGEPRPAARYEDLVCRRATVTLREEDVLRAVDRGRQGYRLHALHADLERQAVVLVLVHPDLPPVPAGCVPPELSAMRPVFGDQWKVVDGEVWHRSTLTIEQAAAVELSGVAATQLRAVARFRLGNNPDWLGCPEVGCPAPVCAVPGEGVDSADVGVLLRVALEHRERYHPPGAPG